MADTRTAPPVNARVAALAGVTVARIHLAPTKDDGTPGRLDGPVQWSGGEEFATLVFADPDQLVADVVSTGTAGTGRFLARADGDLGAGVDSLEQEAILEFVAPHTTHLNMGVDVLAAAPTEEPAPATPPIEEPPLQPAPEPVTEPPVEG